METEGGQQQPDRDAAASEAREDTVSGWGDGIATAGTGLPAGLHGGRGFEDEPGFSVEPGRLLAAARAAESVAASLGAVERRLVEAAESAARSEVPGADALAEVLGEERCRMARLAFTAQETARRLRASAERYAEAEERLTRAALGS